MSETTSKKRRPVPPPAPPRKQSEGKPPAPPPPAPPRKQSEGKPPAPPPPKAPPAPPAPAPPKKPSDGSKVIPTSTKALSDQEAKRAIHSSLEQRVAKVGVIKTPDFEPRASKGQAAATTQEAASAEDLTFELPAWYEPDPNDPFPLTVDDVQLDFYPVQEPFAYVLITRNEKTHETIYRVLEPSLSEEQAKILKFVETTMVDLLDADPEDLDKHTQEEFLRKRFDEILYDYSIVLGEEESEEKAAKERLLYFMFRDFIGEARIDAMMRDDLIEDVSCDGAHQPIFLYHRKYESIKSNVRFSGDAELDSFVIRMAQRAGKHISIAEPILDATMRDGSRLQSTLSKEVSAHGSTFTIRKFRSEPFTPTDLVRFGTVSPEILAYLWIAIQNAASAIYAGGTASGKTTSLNAILLFIPPQMKIVSIEDTREINIPHPNWIAGITRSGFGPRDQSGRQMGEIDMFQLLKNALRQRPEYIIVGEVRGKEAYNLFQAMATGHAAYGTMHADSVDAVIHRLETDPINIPRSLLEALDIVSIQIQTRVGGKRVRRNKQVSEIVGIDPHTREILTNEVFTWQPKDDSFRFSGVSYILERIQVERGLTPAQMRTELENRVQILKWMLNYDVRDFRDVGSIISSYYKDPESVMKFVRDDRPWKP